MEARVEESNFVPGTIPEEGNKLYLYVYVQYGPVAILSSLTPPIRHGWRWACLTRITHSEGFCIFEIPFIQIAGSNLQGSYLVCLTV